MSESKKKKKKKPTSLSSAEQAINAAKWDKQSPWVVLANKTFIKPWKVAKLQGTQQGEK